MNAHQESLEQIRHIRNMMDRSSRFISLSGLSGIAAGIAALVGVWYASNSLGCGIFNPCDLEGRITEGGKPLFRELFHTALLTFLSALILAFLFTYIRSRKIGSDLGGPVSYRLFWSLAIPIITGVVFIMALNHRQAFSLVSPASLFFYGLALVNGSRYTSREILYLGYAILVVGAINIFLPPLSLLCWAIGFGILHIIYGTAMWLKYEKPKPAL